MPRSASLNLANAKLDHNGPAPLYQQIFEYFKKQITSGRVKKNQLLPSEQEIIDHLGVSRITVRRALNELAASGYVTRQRGRGTIVNFNAAAPTISASFDQLLEGLKRMGVETEVRLISCKTIKPGRDLRHTMEVARDDRLQQIIRLRLLDGEPFSYLVSYIPEDVAAGYNEAELGTASLIQLLDKAGHKPKSAVQSITAVAARAEISEHLGIADGVPLLRVHRTMRDAQEKIVQDITAHYRADLFQYQMHLVRHEGERWTEEEIQ